MSDDLERAVSALVKSMGPVIGSPEFLAVSANVKRLEERQRRAARSHASIALLSFLDMDEAGVARIERAIWESGREAGNITGEESWRSYRAECKGQARAVLSELRKMAGEKDG